MHFKSLAAFAALASLAQAHPGHDVSEEVAERRHFINSIHKKDLSHCADKLRARGIEARNIARRSAAVEQARALKGVSKKRDLDSVLATDHDESDTGYTANTDVSKLFTGNSSCLLTPEVTQGPYCKPSGQEPRLPFVLTDLCRRWRRVRPQGHHRR